MLEVQAILANYQYQEVPEEKELLEKTLKGEMTLEEAARQIHEIGVKEGKEMTKKAFREVFKKHGIDIPEGDLE